MGRTLGSFVVAVVAFSCASCTRTDSPSGSGAAGSASASTAAAEQKAITVKGSDTMVILGQRWAEEYMKANPGTAIQVTGGGSGTGIAALINGTTDICEASRPMKDKEKEDAQAKRGAPVVGTKVALDALAIYVNGKSPVTEISLPALRRIYLGETTNWK